MKVSVFVVFEDEASNTSKSAHSVFAQRKRDLHKKRIHSHPSKSHSTEHQTRLSSWKRVWFKHVQMKWTSLILTIRPRCDLGVILDPHWAKWWNSVSFQNGHTGFQINQFNDVWKCNHWPQLKFFFSVGLSLLRSHRFWPFASVRAN